MKRLPLLLRWTMLVVVVVVLAGPFAFMLGTSLKTQREAITEPAWTLPSEPTFENYDAGLRSPKVFTFFGNRLFVISISVGLVLLVSSFAAFAFARMDLRVGPAIVTLVVASLAVPIHSTLVPIYELTNWLGLYDTRWALIGPYVAFSLPISVFVLTEFMRQIPRDLQDAARIDGASIWTIFVRIVLPLSKPGLVTLAIYNAVTLWNEFVFAFVLILSPENRTLPLAIWEFQGEYGMNVPAIMAVLTLTALPLIGVYVVAQERITKGMMAGALK